MATDVTSSWLIVQKRGFRISYVGKIKILGNFLILLGVKGFRILNFGLYMERCVFIETLLRKK